MPTDAPALSTGPASASRFFSAVSLLLRIGLAQVFFLAAINKISDPDAFAHAINGFKVPGFQIQDDSSNTLVVFSAFLVPWVEIVVGLLLASGLWTRAAATVYLVLMATFTAALYSAIERGLTLDCGCFGDLKGFCGGEVGNCNLIQNGVLSGLALIVLVLGGGRASADALLDRGAGAGAGPADDEADDLEFA